MGEAKRVESSFCNNHPFLFRCEKMELLLQGSFAVMMIVKAMVIEISQYSNMLKDHHQK